MMLNDITFIPQQMPCMLFSLLYEMSAILMRISGFKRKADFKIFTTLSDGVVVRGVRVRSS